MAGSVFAIGLLASFAHPGAGQRSAPTDTLTLRGSVIDAVTGRPMGGVALLARKSRRLAVSQADGRFMLRLEPGPDTVVAFFLGYDSLEIALTGDEVGTFDVMVPLRQAPIELEGLSVRVERLEAAR